MLTLRGPSGVRRGPALQDLSLVADGSVLIRDGLIASVGSTRRIENLKEARRAPEISVDGAIVMPGFVDAGLLLAPPDSAALPGKPRVRKLMTEFHEQAVNIMRACMQHGTLHAQIKAGAILHCTRSDVAALRQLAELGDQPVGTSRTWRVHQPPTHRPLDLESYSDTLSYLLQRKLAGGVEISASSEKSLMHHLWNAAAAAGAGINLLWSATPPPPRNLFETVSPRSVFCPCSLTSEDCDALLKTSAPLVFSPARETLEDQPGDSVRQLAANGAAIALSSGYDSEKNPTFNMQMSIALAVLRLRLTTEQAITAATVNAAHAVGIGDAAGTIEVGKRADLLVLNLPDYREIPRRFGINHVGMAIRDGKVLFNRTGWKVSAA